MKKTTVVFARLAAIALALSGPSLGAQERTGAVRVQVSPDRDD